MCPDIPLPAGRTCFTIDDARLLGIGPARLRRADLDRSSRSLRHPGGTEVLLEDLAASLTSLTGHTAASHATAALLWGILLPSRLQLRKTVHLTRPLGTAAPRRIGVVGHRAGLTGNDVVVIYGVTVTSPAWTWTDLAESLSLHELVAAGDSLLRRPDAPFRRAPLNLPDPLCRPDELADVVERRAGARGIRRAREALDLVRPGVDSAPESTLRMLILDAGLPEPVVNGWIVDPAGRRVSRPDLQYPQYRIALEYEGEHHLLDPAQWSRDIERDERLRALGWTVLRFSKPHLEPGRVAASMERIRYALARAAASGAQ
ncbi:hypothetical protein [Arthrobacter sp. Br18]|uniref:hypothetical protein n=1 Tax=Arthrobacter sp. Br18 TaxID=1312954 RepID=UPI0004B69D99|nr:hypothetical protein [Arthrobacter sp. Br18]